MILRMKCSGFKGVIKAVERENKEKKLAPVIKATLSSAVKDNTETGHT